MSYFQPYLQLSRLHGGPDGDPPQGRGRGCLAGPTSEAGEEATQGGVGPSQRDVHTGRLDESCITMITAKDARIVAAIPAPITPLRC